MIPGDSSDSFISSPRSCTPTAIIVDHCGRMQYAPTHCHSLLIAVGVCNTPLHVVVHGCSLRAYAIRPYTSSFMVARWVGVCDTPLHVVDHWMGVVFRPYVPMALVVGRWSLVVRRWSVVGGRSSHP